MQRGIKLNGKDLELVREIYQKMDKANKAKVKPLWSSAQEDFSPLAIIRLALVQYKEAQS